MSIGDDSNGGDDNRQHVMRILEDSSYQMLPHVLRQAYQIGHGMADHNDMLQPILSVGNASDGQQDDARNNDGRLEQVPVQCVTRCSDDDDADSDDSDAMVL
jgi:hypothetical protein